MNAQLVAGASIINVPVLSMFQHYHYGTYLVRVVLERKKIKNAEKKIGTAQTGKT